MRQRPEGKRSTRDQSFSWVRSWVESLVVADMGELLFLDRNKVNARKGSVASGPERRRRPRPVDPERSKMGRIDRRAGRDVARGWPGTEGRSRVIEQMYSIKF